jgi:hypothetical protein
VQTAFALKQAEETFGRLGVADAVAPHPTLSEAIKDAALLALGRAIDVPNRKPAPRP